MLVLIGIESGILVYAAENENNRVSDIGSEGDKGRSILKEDASPHYEEVLPEVDEENNEIPEETVSESRVEKYRTWLKKQV